MTIRDLYQFAIEQGMERDPRGPEELRRQMREAREEYEGLDGKERAGFDAERFTNPFGDTRLVYGDPETPVRRLVCGIDITVGEVLLADALRHHGRPVDLVLGHHTSGIAGALGSRRDTIWPQVRMLTDFGVPAHKAEKLIRKGAEGQQRSVNAPVNQVAEALGLPLMTIHSPADAFLRQEGARALREEGLRTVGDLVAYCDSLPEVRWLIERGKGTEVAVGDRRDPLGKVYFCFYGGWNPTPEVFEAICEAGCGTLWVVATSEPLNEVARKRRVSVVVIPHYPADNFGLNRLFDAAMERFGDFDIVPTSNYVRIRRPGREG
ncbi:MAG: hypothetical protein HY321_13775 [Armatimonadetes bacterium]|nr:hypothetical protein [Armatimonadota bacterium]